MKKAKVLVATVLASGLVLSGCTFEEGLEMVKNWPVQNVYEPAKAFFEEKILGKTPAQEQPQKEEKEDEGEKPAPVAQLTSISISGQYKTEYEVGESFDATGIVVTAAYDDNSTKDVSSQASFSGFSSESVGPCTVTVSFENQTAALELTIVPAVKRAWTSEEEAIFSEHLHGIVLPFFEAEGATPVYDATGDQVRLFDPDGAALKVSGDMVPDYGAKFLASEGWEDVSSDYSAFSSAESGSFWVFERSVQTDEGMRRISVQFFGHNGSKYAKDGDFYLYASDPFSYVFPATEIAAEFAKYNMTPFAIPAPDAQDMYFEFYPDSNNALYHQYGYDDYLNATIYLYGFNEESFAAYIAKFEQAGWVFTSQLSQGVTVYSGTLEIENVGTATIEYLYYTPSFSALNYDYLIAEPAAWPAEAAAALVEKFAPGSLTVIPECPNGTSYTPYMSTNYNEIDVGGDESLKDAYAAILKEAGWTETEDGSYIFVSPAQDIQITLQFTSYGLEIRVAAYIPPAATWPAEDAAKLLPEGGQDSLPAYEGANSYQYYNDNYGAGVTCYVGEGNEDAAMAAYAELLEAAKFTLDSDGYYRSEHDEFKVELWKGTDGAFNIEVTIIAHWPAADVAAAIEALIPGATDVLPALENAVSYTVSASASKVRVTVKFGSSSAASAAQTAYGALLEQAKFTYAGDDEYGDPYYNSEHSEYNVNPWVSSSSLYIDIKAGTFTPPTAGFPAADINAALKAIDSTLTDTLPEYTTDLIYTFDTLSAGNGVEASAMPSDVDAEITLFTANLLTNGWTEAGADSYGDMHYSSPNGQLDVCAWNYYDYYIVVDITIN